MDLNRRLLLAFVAAAAASPAVGQAAIPSVLTGTFSGALQLGGARLRLKLVVAAEGQATLYSIDQGNAAIPASEVKADGVHLVLVFASIGATFDATLTKDRLDGTFTQASSKLPLVLTRGDMAAADPLDGPLTAATLQGFRLRSGTPGMGAAWNRQGASTQILVDGLRSQQLRDAVAVGDIWHLGSLTKSMTATLVARHVEIGTIRWETTVNEALGQVIPDISDAYRNVSLLHLLSHHGGLQPNIDLVDMAAFSRTPVTDPIADRRAYARLALRQPTSAQPGTTMVYSNNGYIVAAAMLEAITGKAWETLVRDGVFAPLGLASAGFGPPAEHEPQGHIIQPDGARQSTDLDNPVALGPAGRVHMSLADLVTYLAAHRDQPAQFLSPKSWDYLHTPHFGGNYALGWVVLPDGTLWHNGSNTAWYAEVSIDRNRHTVAAVTSKRR